MIHFTDYTYGGKREHLIPRCPQCSQNDCVILIDSVLTKEGYGEHETIQTLPIWQCSRCDKVYGDRTCQTTNILSVNVPGGTILQTEPPTTTSTFRYNTENHIFEIEQKIEQLQQKIDSQKEDILRSLKTRIANFTLE